jgi:hypothetical protein
MTAAPADQRFDAAANWPSGSFHCRWYAHERPPEPPAPPQQPPPQVPAGDPPVRDPLPPGQDRPIEEPPTRRKP